MKRLLVIITLLSSLSLNAQLDEWIGKYEGTLHVLSLEGKKSEHKMRVEIGKVADEVYSWTIIYGDSGQDVRAYQMIHMQGNEFQLDEKNGITIQTSKMGNEMISLFEVMGSTLFVSYTLLDGALGVKITSASHRDESGGTMDPDGNTIPNVSSYLTNVSQAAYLKKL